MSSTKGLVSRCASSDWESLYAATSGGRPLGNLRMEASFTEHRLELDANALRKTVKLELEASCSADARMAVDHVLLLPRSAPVAAVP